MSYADTEALTTKPLNQRCMKVTKLASVDLITNSSFLR